MKRLFFLAFLISVFVSTVAAQKDTDPVLQGSASYSMPQSVIDAEIDGTVVVGIQVDRTGSATMAKILSGPMWPCRTNPIIELSELQSTLVETMLKLRFSPALRKGTPIDAVISVTIRLTNSKLIAETERIDPASGKPKFKIVSAGVLNSKAKELPKPAYPNEAKANNHSGAATIQVLIDEKGDVIRAGAVGGAPTLQLPSRDAACRAKYPPLTVEGNPARVSGVFVYNFIP